MSLTWEMRVREKVQSKGLVVVGSSGVHCISLSSEVQRTASYVSRVLRRCVGQYTLLLSAEVYKNPRDHEVGDRLSTGIRGSCVMLVCFVV